MSVEGFKQKRAAALAAARRSFCSRYRAELFGGAFADVECADEFLKLCGLAGQLFRGACHFLGGRRVVFRDRRDILNAGVDFACSGRLLFGRTGDLGDAAGRVFDAFDDLLQCFASLFAELGAFLHALRRFLDQRGDFLGGLA